MVIVFGLAACTGATTTTAGPPESTTNTTGPTVASTTTPHPQTSAASVSTNELGWEVVALPQDVSAHDGILTWTGDELIFWGGEDDFDPDMPIGEPGLAYSPDTRMWRTLPPSSKRATYGAVGVWTGSELVLCCGRWSPFQAVSYEPASDTWRTLADAGGDEEYAEAVWTGELMLVAEPGGVAAYEPASDTWSEVPPSPMPLGRLNELAWTGAELVVWPANGGREVYAGMALDPVSGDWRVLDDPPAWPAMPDIEWTGDDLMIWGGLPAAGGGSERAVGSRLDYADDRWHELTEPLPEPDGCECNLGSQELLWTGSELLVWTGTFGTGLGPNGHLLISYQPETASWSLVSDSPIEWGGHALMADDRIVMRGPDSLAISPPGWQSDGVPIDPVG